MAKYFLENIKNEYPGAQAGPYSGILHKKLVNFRGGRYS